MASPNTSGTAPAATEEDLPRFLRDDIPSSLPHRLPHVSLQDLLAEPQVAYNTGSAFLDDALNGGFLPGNIYDICGPPGSGKTTLALAAASACLGRNCGTVLWIDCLSQIPLTRFVAQNLPRECLSRLVCSYCVNLSELIVVLKSLIAERKYDLVVIDGFSAFFGIQQAQNGLQNARNTRISPTHGVLALISAITGRFDTCFLLLTSMKTTRSREIRETQEAELIMCPALTETAPWNSLIACRVYLYWDWLALPNSVLSHNETPKIVAQLPWVTQKAYINTENNRELKYLAYRHALVKHFTLTSESRSRSITLFRITCEGIRDVHSELWEIITQYYHPTLILPPSSSGVGIRSSSAADIGENGTEGGTEGGIGGGTEAITEAESAQEDSEAEEEADIGIQHQEESEAVSEVEDLEDSFVMPEDIIFPPEN